MDKTYLKKLHQYCTNNKKLISKANKCYCFFCMKEMKSEEIVDYLSVEETAICPYCGIDSIIPDSINDEVNITIIKEMNKYWFN